MARYICTVLIFIASIARAQNVTGGWNGELATGNNTLHVTFHINQINGIYSSTFDVLEQKATNLPASSTIVTTDSLIIDLAAYGIGYKGKINGNSITGNYTQGRLILPLLLSKQLRPQTPHPPFNYVSEDVEYNNAGNTIHFGATLTKPRGRGKFPAVIVISGSGTQDRDGTVFGHHIYAVLADHLTKNGIAVLRVDDRGAGKTTKGTDAAGATSAVFSYDVEAGINYLQGRADIDKGHIGLIGHSEGGIIAPMVAARRKDIDFIVLWGAPAIGGAVISAEQNADQLAQAFAATRVANSAEAVTAFKQLHQQEIKLVATASNVAQLDSNIIKIYEEWKAAQKPEVLKTLTATNESIVGQPVKGMYNGLYNMAWMRFFISYNPAVDLARVKCPVLAINGAMDTQVNAKVNLKVISDVLVKAGNKNFRTVELPLLNHLLQTAKTGNLNEYAQIEETIAPAALNTITNWINTQVK